MLDASTRKLLDLHTAFWNRELTEPIISIDCSMTKRTRMVPTLPPQWEDKGLLTLTPEMLSPDKFQPPPFQLADQERLHDGIAFNTWMPYFRVPWLSGIMGCELVASSDGQTVWPRSYLEDNWYEREDQGFRPYLEWLDTLLEFTGYIVDQYFPQLCIPTTDLTCRGPGDLLLHVLGPESVYLGFHDHPKEMGLLLDRITDLYIEWGRAQLEVIPPVYGGYCNGYGIWSPGTIIRSQEDYAVNLGEAQFEEFLLPRITKVAGAFEYEVFHTHSGFPNLAEWVLGVDDIACIEVALDPTGPTIAESIDHWNRILEKKPLIIIGPVTQQQLEMLQSRLSPSGLWLDIELLSDDQAEDSAWEWSHARSN